MSHDFAQKLWPITNLGVRVIVAQHELAPVDFAHPKLFAPKLEPSEPAVAAGGGADGREVRGTNSKGPAKGSGAGNAGGAPAAPTRAQTPAGAPQGPQDARTT